MAAGLVANSCVTSGLIHGISVCKKHGEEVTHITYGAIRPYINSRNHATQTKSYLLRDGELVDDALEEEGHLDGDELRRHQQA